MTISFKADGWNWSALSAQRQSRPSGRRRFRGGFAGLKFTRRPHLSGLVVCVGHGGSYWIWCVTVHAESSDSLWVVNIEPSRFREWQMLSSVWCVCVYAHECAFVRLGIFVCNYKKVLPCGGMLNTPCAAPPCITSSPYGAFSQTRLIVWHLVNLASCSTFMNYNSCCLPAKMVV